MGPVGRLSPVSLSVFSLVRDLLFDCSRVLEYAKIRTVLQSNCLLFIYFIFTLSLQQNKLGYTSQGDFLESVFASQIPNTSVVFSSPYLAGLETFYSL